MTEEKAKSLIGSKVRGFKFDGFYGNFSYAQEMNSFINMIGNIIDIQTHSKTTFFLVDFGDDSWYYPASLIEAHLVDTEILGMSQQEFIDSQFKTENITASELINQNEQLKADNAELVEVLKECLEGVEELNAEYQEGWDSTIEKAKQLIEKHGK